MLEKIAVMTTQIALVRHIDGTDGVFGNAFERKARELANGIGFACHGIGTSARL
jgi:hypothetical protein